MPWYIVKQKILFKQEFRFIMLFSIIIPAFNAERYLHDSLKSIRMQTFTDYETIIVDDGSTDKTGEIADSFARETSRTHVIHKKTKVLCLLEELGYKQQVANMLFS